MPNDRVIYVVYVILTQKHLIAVSYQNRRVEKRGMRVRVDGVPNEIRLIVSIEEFIICVRMEIGVYNTTINFVTQSLNAKYGLNLPEIQVPLNPRHGNFDGTTSSKERIFFSLCRGWLAGSDEAIRMNCPRHTSQSNRRTVVEHRGTFNKNNILQFYIYNWIR